MNVNACVNGLSHATIYTGKFVKSFLKQNFIHAESSLWLWYNL